MVLCACGFILLFKIIYEMLNCKLWYCWVFKFWVDNWNVYNLCFLISTCAFSVYNDEEFTTTYMNSYGIQIFILEKRIATHDSF
jgi:hypothetical protein